ncbi:hypothetical protein N0V93_005057 [Gnomoniopsis smithogilvyi]|uniref:Uncharacterized protein n=1 Tax=Gnomoniopsis smithogilvyi TaxID=1191159 RepID=A0A9W8YTU9_9PEZI|nr:hypothetical protein N0V93_005057 [Gnomoniopsis smithogilvyi]
MWEHAAVHEVFQALGEMFDQSVAFIRADVLGSDPNSFGFMSGKMRVHVSWGQYIRADTYMALFHELYKARGRWHEDPQQPFNVEEHGILAQAIDRFHEAKGGGSWELKGLDKLARADGYVHEEED